MSLEQDLRERWRPSQEQIDAADRILKDHPDGVWTPHLLVNKEYGIWTADIEVVTFGPDEVFPTRDECSTFVQGAAQGRHSVTGLPLVGGYTWHSSPGSWAVWEDILARWPKS